MEALIKAAQLILSLSILVIFHEFGHFIFAKLFKTRVEKFYLFFDPWFSLFKLKKGDTEYGIGWLPLGGYVKISGMIDESMDKEQLKKPPQPYEFRSKPAWQRLLIMLGGVMVNFILAIGIYTVTLYAWGEKYLPAENVKYGVYCDSVALSVGLQHGDKILSADNQKFEDFHDIKFELIFNEVNSLQVLRDGEKMSINLPDDIKGRIIESQSFFIEAGFPFIIDEFIEDSPAEKAGFQINDQVIAINGKEMPYFSMYPDELSKYKNTKINLTVLRNEKKQNIPVTVNEDGLIGVGISSENLFDFATKQYSLLQSIPAGVSRGYKEIENYLKQLKIIFSGEGKAYKQVGSFISIGKLFPSTWNWQIFWSWTAMLSIMLAVLNILPIPALDGGHVLFLLYEIVAGRKPGDKFLEYAQIAGMIILLTLMVFALGNDIFRHVLN